MATKNRVVYARPSPAKDDSEVASGFTFPADLIHPQQSQIEKSEDAVGSRVRELDAWAQKLGEGFGISYTNFILNPLESVVPKGSSDVLALLYTFASRDERISLERRGGRWGLYFTREPVLMAQDRKTETISLRDAPLDIRDKFLLKSEEFFKNYLKLCEDRLGKMKSSVKTADRTLELLNNLHLE